MDFLVLIGRILFAVLFLTSGYNHVANREAMSGYASSKGVPSALFFVVASGVWIIVGSLLVLLGLWADLGALMLVVFLIATAFLFHPYWRESDPGTRLNEMNHFLKDIGLAGAGVAMFGMVVQLDDEFGLALTGPLF